MADAILRIKTVMDIGDAASNISALQKGLSKLKLPDKLSGNLNKNISEFYKEYDKYQRKMSEGIKTQSDQTQAERSLNRMKALYSSISKELNQVTKLNLDDIIDLGSGDFKHIADDISRTVKEINKIKVNKKPFEDAKMQIESLTKSKKVTGDDGILNRMLGHINKGEIVEAKNALDELKRYAEKAAPRTTVNKKGETIAAPGTMNPEKYKQLQAVIATMEAEFGKADAKAAPLIQRLNELQKELGETKAAAGKDIIGGANDFKNTVKDVEKVTDSLKRMHQEEYSFKRQTQDIDRQIQSYFGLAQMIRKVGDIARAAFNTVKELDAAMVETAVVTNFDVGDMWNMLPEYTAQANELGSSIKDVYEAATLYFQQGLNKQQSLGLANETLKMARIGGLQAAEATNMMTAALRGFNMEINGTSAQRINDVYSELAAITAADTKEIGSAMERTASIANSANMKFETTSAFLSQMIETTREAPENLGTAMKTIIARFQEMKQDPTKLVDSEGVAMDANKIDTALKTIGVDLTNQKGEFRDLDDVFLDISAKWDSLTQGQQRYIATIAAGSRQQSRFIAMMQNHERVMELVEAANNSAGASQKQFEKTLDSMSSKLNRLKNAWNQFTMGLMNDKLIKGGTDALTKSFTIINKIIDFLGKIPPKPFEGITKSALTLATTLGMLNIGKKMTRGTVMGVAGWWKQEGGFVKNFKQGYGAGEINKIGQETAKGFSTAFNNHFKKEGKSLIPNAIVSSIKGVKGANEAFQQTFAGAYGKYSAGALKAGWTSNIENEIRTAWSKASKGVDASVFGKQDADEYINGYIEKMRSGKMNATQVARRIKGETGVDISGQQVGNASEALKKTDTAVQKFGSTVANAGGAIQMFGTLLQGTPLAPFGTALSMVGMSISMLGSNLAACSALYIEYTTSATFAGGAAKAFGMAVWESFGPIAVVMAAIIALIGVYKLLDKAIVTDKERLESAKDAAASASEAFDMAKQETSELNDALSRVEENEKAFETLAVGTAEFNDQLVNSNELISELLKKYPMLNNEKYLSTDENGLMHLSKEGIKAVKDYQKEIQSHASAISMIQGADFSSLEKEQKAEQLRKDANKRGLTEKQRQNKLDEADLLEEQSKTEKELSRKNAFRTALNNKEIQNVEALASAYTDLYDKKREAAEVEVEEMDTKERLQAYADFYNYTYDASTKKMTNAEGTEVEYDKEIVKDELIEQTVLLDFEENAGTLDGILSDLDSKFNETLTGTFERSNYAISDLLGSNIEMDTDLVEDVLSDTSGLQKAINSLQKEELAAILGITTDEMGDSLDVYKKQAVDLLQQKAKGIAEAQYKSFSNLAGMMAQAQQGSITDAILESNKNTIRDQIQDLTAKQAANLSTIGETLQANVGDEAMSAFIDKASFIYLKRGKGTIEEFDKIIEDVNWESPTSRLEAYNNMLNSTDENVKKVGESMLGTANEANIVGAAFDEFLGGDWLELAENVDELKNSFGEIDGAHILEVAENSKTLKTLLDTGRVSAGGLAMALEAISDGSIITANTAVLELLSSLTKVTDAALEAHNIIENFDPGVDYSESNDFMIEGAEKVKELMDDNKWGNPQLESYIKLAAGEEKWNQTYAEFGGDLKKTTQALDDYALAFKDGITPVYDKLTTDKGINGEDITKNIEQAVKHSKIDQELADKFNQVDISKDDNGFIQFDFGELTTEEFQKYLEIAGGMGDQAAAIMMEHLANYNETEGAELAANDLKARLKDPDFQKSFMTEDGKLAIDNASLKTLEDVLGKENFELLAKELGFKDIEGKTAGEQLKNSAFKVVDENGERISGDKLVKDYAKTFYEKETKGEKGKTDLSGLSNVRDLQTDMKLDLAKVSSDLQAKNASLDQAQEGIWQTYQSLKGEGMVYNGQKLEGDYKTKEELLGAIETLTEKQQWYDIGQSIAEGIINFIDSNTLEEGVEEKPEETGFNLVDYLSGAKPWPWEKTTDKTEEPSTDEKPKETGFNLIDYISGAKPWPWEKTTDKTTAEGSSTQTPNTDLDSRVNEAIEKVNSGFNNLLGGITPESIDTPEKQKALAEVVKATSPNVEELTPELYKAFDSLNISIDEAVRSGLIKEPSKDLLNQIKQKAGENADAQAEANADGYTGGGGHGGKRGLRENGPKKAQEAQGDQESTYTVKTEDKDVEETKEKVDDLNTTVSAGGTYNLNVSGKINQLSKAAKAAASLNKNAGEKSIKVKTGKVDTRSVKTASSSINKMKPEINVGAKDNATAKAETWRKKIDKKKASISVSASATGSWSKDFTINVKVNKKNVGSTTVGGGKDDNLTYKGGFITPNNVQYRAKGGRIFQKKFTDTVPAMLTPGEYVQRTAAVKYFGVDFMRKINHKDLAGALQAFGSAANGRYGRLGPKGKGGLTLTGEKGFEIAWLPSESQSMILGTQGPQMLNLPSDAVVYTHEQSKKIIRQKSIPAGSHSGMNLGGGGNNNNSSKKKKKKKKKNNNNNNNDKTTAKLLQKAEKVSVWWENQTRKVDATQRKVDKQLKQFETELSRIGATTKSIKDFATTYRKQLNESIKLNKESRNKANKELKNLDKKKSKYSISYEVTKKEKKKGKTTTKKETKKSTVNLAAFIKEDKKHGTYVIDQKAINKVAKKNKSKAQAIKDLAEKEINDRISKRNTALDNIDKAQEALAKINNDIYESFKRWETSLTKVYALSQKLEELNKRLAISGSRAELQFAKLEAGVTTSGQALQKIINTLNKERNDLITQATGKQQAATLAKEEFNKAISFNTYASKFLSSPNSSVAQEDYTAAKLAFKLLDELNMDSDTFNYAKAVSNLSSAGYNKATEDKIKEILDNIFEKQNDYLSAIDEAYQVQSEIYNKIEEMQSFISEFEQDLLSGLEEQAEDQIQKLDKINSSLSEAFKNLLDEVKRKLDERRSQEDNQKTESDISKKQQRLAALRADTSGGHQVEIAQLEKEIAEAQQSYQRTLEDQLLDKLQNQADKAEKQRQHQIELLEAQKELAKETGTNLAQVKEWLKNPSANKEQIKQAWLANKDYDEATPNEQTQLEEQFESEWTKYQAYLTELPSYQNTVTSSLKNLESNIDQIADNLVKIKGDQSLKAVNNARGAKKRLSASEAKKLGYSAQELKNNNYSTGSIVKAGYKEKDLRKAGITPSEIKTWNKKNPKNKISVKTFKNANFSAKEAHEANYSDKEIASAYSAKEFSKYKPGAKGAKIAAKYYSNAQVARAYGNKIAMTTLDMSGKATQAATGASAKTLQSIINNTKGNKNTKQKDMAGVQVGTVDINGGKKGGKVKDSHISSKGTTVGANKGSTLYTKDWDKTKGKVKSGAWKPITIDKLSVKDLKKYPIDAKQALIYAIKHNKVGSKINKNFDKLVKEAKIVGNKYTLSNKTNASLGSKGVLYYNTSKGSVKKWDAKAGKLTEDKYNKKNFLKQAQKNNDVSREYAQALIKKKAYTKKQLQKKGVKKFATGGLADQTGPAWLDGTPSKPELVLNAKDTQNFLALRDVLNKAVSSANSTSNTYGDTSYEININVDHINNDYDVDRIAERVKKNIVKDARYRNVTQVRNLR